jgi:hypothetical protein
MCALSRGFNQQGAARCAALRAKPMRARDHRMTVSPDVLRSATANERRPIGVLAVPDGDASEANRVQE